ncbi:MAG: DUF488 domain-containing protein [Bacteroidetes bacterium]|nr:DUF488 domain-containing protein [Bacteroidota bacterium]
MSATIAIKRVYEAPSKEDGYRVLVDRLWPRGLTKEAAAVDEWAKEIAPSAELRKWYCHDPAQWPEFQQRYKEELRENEAVKAFLKTHQTRKHITLLYASKSEEYNQAIVLQHYLAARLKGAR